MKVFTGNANPEFAKKVASYSLERIEKSRLKEVWVTDTIPIKQKSNKVHCVSVAPLVAEAMKRIHSKGSVSALF